MFYLIGSLILVICLPNVSVSITNQQFIASPGQLTPSRESELNRFLIYVNNPQLRPRERFREHQRQGLASREKDAVAENNNYEKFKSEQPNAAAADNKENHHAGHHRDQRRTRFEKNLYDSNRSADNQQQHQWLPEQTIWRPYYLPRRMNPPFRNGGIVPFQGNLIGQPIPRMPPPYELFPPTSINQPPPPQQPLNLNSRLPNNQQSPSANRFNPVLVDNNGVFNVELVNDRFLNPIEQQLNYGNVHIINENNELEKEQPSLEKKINDKLKLDGSNNNNSSEIQLINSINSGDGQFNKANSPLIDLDSNAQFNDPLADRTFSFQANGPVLNSHHKNVNRNKLSSSDPQLFVNRIKQTVVTNESFTMQNPNAKPRLEEKSNVITNLNETTKILDTSPQQYSPVHFRQTFEQIQAQQKENQRFSQFTPVVYSSSSSSNQQMPTTKSSLDVVPQLMNPLTSSPPLVNPQLLNALQHTSPSPSLMNSYNTPNLIKRLQQQQFQNALLARLGNHPNGNSIEAARRMNSLVQERATRERANLASSSSSVNSLNSSPSMDASKSNAKEFFSRRTNTHRYVIVTILLAAILVISIGITVIYVKQRRLNLHNTPASGDLNPEISSSYGIRRFYQRSSPSSNTQSDSDSYGPSYLSNRSVATSLETGPKTLSSTLRVAGNVITHR